MSTTAVGTIGTNAAQPVDATSNSNKTDATLLQTLKMKIDAGKKYILDHKVAVGRIGQISGTAALIVGGASMLFSGIAANLTVAGTPLGIPLMIAGAVLLVTGTIFQVMHQVERKDSTVGEKIKDFFKETFNNLKIGTLAGVGITAACAAMPLTQLIPIVPIIIKLVPYLSKDLNKEENWKAFIEIFPKDSKFHKMLEGTKTLNEFLAKFTKPVQDIIEPLGKSDSKGKPNPVDPMEYEGLAALFAMDEELAKTAEWKAL